MLNGGDKLFGRLMSKKEIVKAYNVQQQISNSSIETAQLSSRRRVAASTLPEQPES